MSYNLRVLQVAALALVLAACGDDAGSGGEAATETEGDATSTGVMTTTAMTTMTTMSMTTADDTTSTTSDDTGGSSGQGSGSTAGDSGSSDGTADESSSGTGDAVDCSPLMMMECEMARGCVWAGNPNNGECISDDPAQCEELVQQDCMSNPVCDWDNMAGTCNPA